MKVTRVMIGDNFSPDNSRFRTISSHKPATGSTNRSTVHMLRVIAMTSLGANRGQRGSLGAHARIVAIGCLVAAVHSIRRLYLVQNAAIGMKHAIPRRNPQYHGQIAEKEGTAE
jgi:hypothetical protein